MGKVYVLPPEIISKIAAGEIIERPASVVKELIENALDAQSQDIEIHLKGAGKTFIGIKDNGSGIEADDIEKIFLRHSTSKINKIDDLYSINSLGFRGEALYSIAAISDITLRSKTQSANTGWEIHLRGNEKLDLRPVNMPVGTDIEIKELFFNTPARKKFLKSDTTELHQILNIFTPYTLLYPQRRFSIEHHNKPLLDLLPHQNHILRTAKALNLNQQHIFETKQEFPQEQLTIHFLLGDINIQRPKKDIQFIFINNRPVHNYIISFHLNEVYKLIFPAHLYPFFAVFITLPAENLDVNVHPTKREVKIKNESVIVSLLRSICEKALLSQSKAKQIENIYPKQDIFTDTYSATTEPHIIKEPSLEQEYGHQQLVFSSTKEAVSDNQNFPFYQKNNLKSVLQKGRFIGTFLKKYLFFEADTSLLIIDQHAAQERVTYELLITQIEAGKVEIQHLLSPILLRLSPQEMLIWEIIKDKLENVGLSTTLWDNENIALHSHPLLIKNPEIALRNLLAGEERTRFDLDTLARRACRNSLMAGYDMSSQQAEYLKNQLLTCKDPFSCPHGRPTVIEMQDKILEKQFLR